MDRRCQGKGTADLPRSHHGAHGNLFYLKINAFLGKNSGSWSEVMQKTIVVLIVLISGVVAYLIYDWHAKIRDQVAEPSIPLYSWTDAEGNKHFTDALPPQGALNVQKSMGYKYVAPPLIVTIRDTSVAIYHSLRSKIVKPEESKGKNGREAGKQ
jgi:hypothetical protein